MLVYVLSCSVFLQLTAAVMIVAGIEAMALVAMLVPTRLFPSGPKSYVQSYC